MHTWDSNRGPFDGPLQAPGWEHALDQLAAAGVPVVLVEGGVDQVPVSGRAAALAGAIASVRYVRRTDATHLLPLIGGGWCATLIAEHLDQTPAQSRTASRAGVR